MRWESHQAQGFFGLSPRGQPRYMDVVDIERALEVAAPALELWVTASAHEPAPAFSGGVLDSWPAWAADALGIARQETTAINSYFAGVREAEARAEAEADWRRRNA